jgi:hypothetical protein
MTPSPSAETSSSAASTSGPGTASMPAPLCAAVRGGPLQRQPPRWAGWRAPRPPGGDAQDSRTTRPGIQRRTRSHLAARPAEPSTGRRSWPAGRHR